MAYQKQTWRDYDDNKTEVVNMNQGAVVTPERLNHMETGIANSADKAQVTAQLAQTVNSKVDKNGSGQIHWSNIAQDVRENITSGSTAVVGNHAVTSETLDNDLKMKFDYLGVNFERGSINTVGADSVNIAILRTPMNSLIHLDRKTELKTDGTTEFQLYLYNSNGAFIKMVHNNTYLTTYTVIESGFYRVKLRRVVNPDANIMENEVNMLGNTLKVLTSISNTQLKNEQSDLRKDTHIQNGSYLIFEGGSINNSGANSFAGNVIRTPNNDLLPLKKGTVLYTDGTTVLSVARYTITGDFLGFLTENASNYVEASKIIEDGYYRVKLKRNNDGDTEILTGDILKISKTLLINAYPSTKGFELTQDKPTDESKNVTFDELLMRNKVAVSDDFTFVSGSASIMSIDKNTGIAYVTYLASRTKYGESRDIVALSVFPITSPERAKHFIVCETGVPIGDKVFTNPFEPNIIQLDNKVRVYFIPETYNLDNSYNNTYFYRDFTKHFNEFEEPKVVMFSDLDDSTKRPLTKNDVNTYITSKGLTPDPGYEDHPVIFTTRVDKYDGLYYGAITGHDQYPIIFHTVDGAEFVFRGVMPVQSAFETQLAINDSGVMTIINRAFSPKYFISNNLGITFSQGQDITTTGTRPQILTYKDKILLIHGVADDMSNLKANAGRTKVVFKTGNGLTVSSFETKLTLQSKYGIVYPSVFNYNDDIYMTFSNSERFSQHLLQAKDSIFFVKLGELDG